MRLIGSAILAILLGLLLGLPIAGIIWFFGGGFHYLSCARVTAVVLFVIDLICMLDDGYGKYRY